LLSNILLNVGGRSLLVVFAVISTPVLVHRLGTPRYGVYILAVTAGGLLGLLDFGLGPALVTFLSQSSKAGDGIRSQKLVSTAMSLYLCIGIVGGSVFALLVPWLVGGLLQVPAGLANAARQSLWLSAAGFGITMCLSVFNAIPTALERYDVLTKRVVGISIVTTVATIGYALMGGSLPGLVLINVLGGVGVVLSFYFASRSLLPAVSFRPGFDSTSFTQLARFSAFKFMGSLGGTLVFRFDQFAVGALLGVGAVGYYAIPANGILRVHGFLLQLVGPLFPRVSKLRGDAGAIRALYLRSSRGVAIVAVMILVTLFVFADPILRFWIGGHQGELVARASGSTMRWLVAAFLIQSLAAVPVTFCEALGKPHINNGFAAVSAIIHVPLVLLLVPRLGIAGAAIALLINSLAQTVLFIIIVSHRLARVRLRELSKTLLLPAFAAGLVAGLIGYSLRTAASSGPTLLVCLIGLPLIYLLAAAFLGGREFMQSVVVASAVRISEWPRLSLRLRNPGGP
jgi:O-antigen/teichoic acid export membrane protein